MKNVYRWWWWLGFVGLAQSAWCATAATPDVPQRDLVAQWRFDRVEGDLAPDLSGQGRPVRLESPAFHPEVGGARSLRCDGFATSGVVQEPTPLALPAAATLAIWVRPERARRNELVFGRPNPTPEWTTPTIGLVLDMGRPVFGVFASKGRMLLEGPKEVPLQTWTLLGATADGRKMTLWINGQPVAEMEQKQALPPARELPWYVGRSATQYFRGRLGEAAVWQRALSAAEMAAFYAATAGRYPQEPAAVVSGVDARDRTVLVASPGSNPDGTWRDRPTRLLEGVAGFVPQQAPPLDRWGGRKDRPARTATGYFRVERVEGRWWLITPEGHLYWNVGVNAVNKPKAIPTSQADAWAEKAARELRELGFNGLGNWSLDAFRRQEPPLPWCVRFDFLSSFAKENQRTYATSGHTGYAEQCPPVFHPGFVTFARRYAERAAATAKDPSIIGLFTDNEIQSPVDLLDRHLRLDPKDPYLRHGREAAFAWLQGRGRPADPKQLNLRDRLEFVAHFMATYARIVREALRPHDANHLILGPRFNVHGSQFENPWFWPAVAPYLDVVAVNYYALWGPQREDLQAWCEAMGKPLMLTEWYAKAGDATGLSNRQGAGWFVRTQEDRARYYQHFLLAAFETPALVGVHYFKYLDDPSESVALDSAGGANKGLYTSTGEPWVVLQRRAQAVNTQAYRLIDFFDQRRPSLADPLAKGAVSPAQK